MKGRFCELSLGQREGVVMEYVCSTVSLHKKMRINVNTYTAVYVGTDILYTFQYISVLCSIQHIYMYIAATLQKEVC